MRLNGSILAPLATVLWCFDRSHHLFKVETALYDKGYSNKRTSLHRGRMHFI